MLRLQERFREDEDSTENEPCSGYMRLPDESEVDSVHTEQSRNTQENSDLVSQSSSVADSRTENADARTQGENEGAGNCESGSNVLNGNSENTETSGATSGSTSQTSSGGADGGKTDQKKNSAAKPDKIGSYTVHQFLS